MPWISTFAIAIVVALSTAAQANRPNVVLILVDDMGLHDLSIEGSTFYRSPNIDNLARGGMRFTQGYANCRVCSPSRASIQLGQFTARHGITQWIGANLVWTGSVTIRFYRPNTLTRFHTTIRRLPSE